MTLAPIFLYLSALLLEAPIGVVTITKPVEFTPKALTPSTIYDIQCDIDLKNRVIELPADCTLKFSGGSIRNGTLVGDNTRIDNPSNLPIFYSIGIADKSFQFINDRIYVDWFAGKSDADRVQAAVIFASKNRNSIDFLSREYIFDHTVNISMGQVFLRGTGSGGEYRDLGTKISSSPHFKSEYEGEPLFFVNGERKNANATLGLVSGRITGITFTTNKKQDVFHFLLSRAPSRPLHIDYCSFLKCGTVIRLLDNGLDAELGFLYVENCTMIGNKWNIVSHGQNALMGLYFCKNVAEQCDGNINLGFSEHYTRDPFNTPAPKKQGKYSGCANIVITDNLLEGTVDCIYINGGKCMVDIERNYFESHQKQFIVLSFTNPYSTVTFQNNYIADSDDVSLQLRNCNYTLQKNFSTSCLKASGATPIK